jgi:hypothetical protein
MTEQEIQQEVEEMLEALKVYGFPPLCEREDLPKFAWPVISRVARIKGISENVMAVYYWRKEHEST